jgi:uncharacterized membrane protein YhiD involved in acid resistance
VPTGLSSLWSSGGQWSLVLPVLLALVLTTVIGLEREAGAKSAGLRTPTLVGVGAAVFMLVTLRLAGRGDLAAPASELAEVEGVRSARTGHEDTFDEE